jgi:hypothetical protein
LETAIAETIFHFETFARDSADPTRSEEMRVLVGTITADFEDVAALPDADRLRILDKDAYAESQAYARRIRTDGAAGVIYPSVRAPGGECLGAFRPRVVGLPRQERHLKYRWNGSRVDRYFDYHREVWVEV